MPPLIEITCLSVRYGAVEALKGVSLELGERDIVAVLGANGAGKTSLLKSISRIVPPSGGQVLLNGQDLARLRPHLLAAQGIAHVPEGRRIFPTLSVEENLRLGAYGIRRTDRAEAGRALLSYIYEIFPILSERKRQFAGTLSGGEQQMLAIGRALLSKPRVLLLDEPSLGLAPIVVQEIFRVIRRIHEEEGVSILLVEQNARLALGIARYGYILELGRVAVEGEADRLSRDEAVKAAYLGGAGLSPQGGQPPRGDASRG